MSKLKTYPSRRIAETNIPGNLHSDIGLARIYGIGRPLAKTILKDLKIEEQTKIAELTEKQITEISKYIKENCIVNGELIRKRDLSIKRLKDINCYKGYCHKNRIPARGQSSKTNARTVKGPRKTVANKKKAV